MEKNINSILETSRSKESNGDISRHHNKNAVKGGFFSFQFMLSGALIKILYVLGMISITIGGFVLIIMGLDSNEPFPLFGGFAMLLLGNIFWRILCESWILIFSLHETTVSILKELKTK